MQLAVLMTCHNRRDKTVACLRAFQMAAEAFPTGHFTVFLTDDGSTDGTAEAVQTLGLDIHVIDGPGDLYWNRGMVRAWDAAQTTREFNGYLLLNDDVLLDPDAITRVMNVSEKFAYQAVVVGATRDPITGGQTYGGIKRISRWHPGRTERLPVASELQEADTFNANFVFIPSFVFARVGTLDPAFHHGMGDFDYGLRAKKAGVRQIVVPGTVGTCPANPVTGTWRDPELPLRQRLLLLESPKGLPRREWSEYLRRHGTVGHGILAWSPTFRAIALTLAGFFQPNKRKRAN